MAAALMASGLLGLCSGARLDREHQVKTGFIYSIAKYCEWDFSHLTRGKFVIGVFRTRAFDPEIDVLNGKTIRDRVISVVKLKAESELVNCQVAVVGDVGADSIHRYVKLCRNSGTLLVGESEGFAQDGGTVGLLIKDGNVRFDVNLQSAATDRVSLSSKLLVLAEQVYR